MAWRYVDESASLRNSLWERRISLAGQVRSGYADMRALRLDELAP